MSLSVNASVIAVCRRVTVVCIGVLLVLIGCGMSPSHNNQTAQERKAIELVAKHLNDAMTAIDSSASSDDPRAKVRQMYETFLKTDVSACPDDFRGQYQGVVEASRQLKDAVNNVPKDGWEAFGYLLSQLGSSKPDFQGKVLTSNVEIKLQRLGAELIELEAVARKHGAKGFF